ncbi:hypothetical protein [Priestia megaterium]|uniref:hypothetical protein n=1 Tax=Priestia megaterium TaxID=1404 RepID=UPI001866BF25|nr:hypothetical protein [Priestia megaterium]MBE2977741.1 hypothetical protein [Priestia megaterium]
MSNEKKERKQFNWRFKGDESTEVMEWFNNQGNITSSLESILNHIIDIYGTGDIMNHQTQKQLFKDSMLLESLKGKEFVTVNHDIIAQPQVEKVSTIESVKTEFSEVPNESTDEMEIQMKEEPKEDSKPEENHPEEVSKKAETNPTNASENKQPKKKKRNYMKNVNSQLF